MIDWDGIRERGESGELTGEETDALVELARYAVDCNVHYCELCNSPEPPHRDDCPIAVLERASTPDIWYGPKPETEEVDDAKQR